MDHLALPRDPISIYPRIPYICAHIDADADFFLLQRSYAFKWGVQPPSRAQDSQGWVIEAAFDHGVTAVEPFLQRWIFFGILREIFLPFDLFETSEFVEEREGFVHTRCLARKAQHWSTAVERLDPVMKKEFGDRMYECLNTTWKTVHALYHNKQASSLGWNQDIKVSILVILDTISALADSRLTHSSGESGKNDGWPHSFDISIRTNASAELMIKHGWCRSEIGILDKKLTFMPARLYMQQMRRLLEGVDHSECDEHTCAKTQIAQLNPVNLIGEANIIAKNAVDHEGNSSFTPENTNAYEPAHVNTGCSCGLLGPDKSAVAQCLDSGSYPLLRISGSEIREITMDVVSFGKNIPYVALSHVWVDGLGNPEVTRLPACQAYRLGNLVKALISQKIRRRKDRDEEGEERIVEGVEVREESQREDRELLFWCDTYCCPTQGEDPQRRILALSKLRDVYVNATYVLVLDRELEKVTYADVDVIEGIARVITSRWTKRCVACERSESTILTISRLWTFQEGALARSLLFQFADQAVDLRDLWLEIRSLGQKHPHHRYISRSLAFACVELKAWLSQAAQSTTGQVSLLAEAMRQRQVTVPSDEPLCLAVALDLDVGVVAECETTEERMQAFWRLAVSSEQGVSFGIIFNPWPRLAIEGYRWAPASFVRGAQKTDGSNLIDTVNTSTRAAWTAHGLRVRSRGWRIEVDLPIKNLENSALETPQRDSMMDLRDSYGNWYAIGHTQNLQGDGEQSKDAWDFLQNRTREWFLILGELGSSRRMSRGLLTYRAITQSGPDVYHSVALVSVRRNSDPAWDACNNIVREHATALRDHSVARRLQLRSLFDTLVGSLLRRVPAFLKPVLRKLCKSISRLLLNHVRRRFDERLDIEAEKAESSSMELRDLVHGDHYRPIPWRGMLLASILGMNGAITELFDSEHEWIVD